MAVRDFSESDLQMDTQKYYFESIATFRFELQEKQSSPKPKFLADSIRTGTHLDPQDSLEQN